MEQKRLFCQLRRMSSGILCLLGFLGLLALLVLAQSCNVVRTITNKSEYYQRGDTSVMIQTRTTESYDATKH